MYCTSCYWFLANALPPNQPRFLPGLCQECGCRPAFHYETVNPNNNSNNQQEANDQLQQQIPDSQYTSGVPTPIAADPSPLPAVVSLHNFDNDALFTASCSRNEEDATDILNGATFDESDEKPNGKSWFKNPPLVMRNFNHEMLKFRCRHCKEFAAFSMNRFHQHLSNCAKPGNYCEKCPICGGICFGNEEMEKHFPLCQRHLAYEKETGEVRPMAEEPDESPNDLYDDFKRVCCRCLLVDIGFFQLRTFFSTVEEHLQRSRIH